MMDTRTREAIVATHDIDDRIAMAYTDSQRPQVERFVLEWTYGRTLGVSDYRCKLWEAILAANARELSILALAYPDEVQALALYRTTWLQQKLRDEGLLSG